MNQLTHQNFLMCKMLTGFHGEAEVRQEYILLPEPHAGCKERNNGHKLEQDSDPSFVAWTSQPTYLKLTFLYDEEDDRCLDLL